MLSNPAQAEATRTAKGRQTEATTDRRKLQKANVSQHPTMPATREVRTEEDAEGSANGIIANRKQHGDEQ